MPLLRAAARRVLPGPVHGMLRKWFHSVRPRGIVYRGDYPNWQAARADSGGYDSPAILEKSMAAALKVKRGEAAWERDTVVFQTPEYRHPLLAALLYAASARQGCVRVLDIGGGPGSSYFQHRRRLGALRSLDWRVVEQPHFVERGNALLADASLRFYSDIDTAAADGLPDLVLLSSVLPYVESPFALLDRLIAMRIPLVVIDRNIVFEAAPTRLTVQRVPRKIYAASYPCWILDEREIAARFAPAYELLDVFSVYQDTVVDLGDARALYKGYTFRLRGG